MTTANKVTVVRILLIPVFIVLMLYHRETGLESYRLLALACFATAALSDGIDGYIARRFNQRSQLGAFLDPLADKLLLTSAVVLLSLHYPTNLSRIPLWLTAIIIGRDVLITVGAAIIYYTFGRVAIQPHAIGKVASVTQMAVVIWILLKWDVGLLRYLLLGAGICTGISGGIYLMDWMRQISASPISAADPNQRR